MTASSQPHLRARALEIHALQILSAGGRWTTVSSVRCPDRRQSMALDLCLSCDRSGGITGAPAGADRFVDCHGAGPDLRPAARDAADPEPSAADRTAVGALCARGVVAVRSDLPLAEVAPLLLERDLDALPVVDAEGRPLGIVSKTDLLRPGAGDATVFDGMTHAALTVPEGAPVSEAASLMAANGVHQLPVVDGEGKVVGLLGSLEVLRWLVQQDGALLPSAGNLQGR
ncbi:CBS domain-containing protein [Anaeromyxobacter paludicola]|uniref:CBS domain-containing protein n=1 Tax=Anaeromyxobacter paludicola TaxID=2918171 RepID=A0ABM7X856_9BACT|nr:CBS domain-containing protein [Anaeromyxobacter paludicola]BDG08025.1 hypothetical protein AMPC_11380 [Anaeromyxobacter paludicola]